MMRKPRIITLTVTGILGIFLGLTIHLAFSAENKRKATDVDEAKVLRQRLATLASIEDNDRFLLEYWKLLAQHRVQIAVKKGDRYIIGGGLLVEGPGTRYKLISRDDTREVVDKIAHVLTNDGSWKALPQEDILGATHIVISTDHYVFVVDCGHETISVLNR